MQMDGMLMKNSRMVEFGERLDLSPFMAPGALDSAPDSSSPSCSGLDATNSHYPAASGSSAVPEAGSSTHTAAAASSNGVGDSSDDILRGSSRYVVRGTTSSSIHEGSGGSRQGSGGGGGNPRGGAQYELQGIIVHEGLRNSTSSGHYIAHLRGGTDEDGKSCWWECNDGQVCSGNASMLHR